MLAFLRGTIRATFSDSVIVEVANLGYRVHLPSTLRERLRVGESVEFYTHEVIRDDRRELFGVASDDALGLFHDLIGVSGVGPKSAIGMLALGSPGEIRRAIAREDVAYLSKVVGIGRKTAERVVLDLKGKMQERIALAPVTDDGAPADDHEDLLAALAQLGYKVQEIREVIRKMPEEATTTEAKLKVALRALARPS
ncbi:Holliday junction branch migration protein RuvA [Candidatus Uhrbacteria bacterium]|nr:Holliday junction branch migration protein RuvA [Candidatus Uhrbacteria bacterium]